MNILIVTNNDSLRINHIVDSFNAVDSLDVKVIHQYKSHHKMSILEKICYKLKLPLDIYQLNKRLLKEINDFNPSIVFIIKGNIVRPSTLKSIKSILPNAHLVSWTLDNMYAWHNRSIYYTLGVKFYDIVFTTKSYNVDELKKLGAKNVKFLYQAYSKKYHIPCEECNKTKFNYDILFIGMAEVERVKSLTYLAENGIKVYIYGGGWDKKIFLNLHKNLVIHPYDLTGYDYSNAISCSKISLCFLRKANHDLHTSRTIEIPACRGFMLAEKTQEHLDLFEEDREAVYFSSNEELLEKIKYYLKNKKERIEIANNGFLRCKNSGYSYDDSVKIILKEVAKL